MRTKFAMGFVRYDYNFHLCHHAYERVYLPILYRVKFANNRQSWYRIGFQLIN